MRAWTLGSPRSYDSAVKMKGNGKAPGGYAFRTREDALSYKASLEDSAYEPYEMELPDEYEKCVTRSYVVAQSARHVWHTAGDDPVDRPPEAYMNGCGVCEDSGRRSPLDFDALLVRTAFINPDTGEVA